MQGTGILLISIALVATTGAAAESPVASFDLRVNIADQHTEHLTLSVPAGTRQRLQIHEGVSLELRPWDLNSRWTEAIVTATSGGTERILGAAQRPPQPAGLVMQLSFSVCGERLIALEGAAPGRCADLPPMATPDKVFGPNGVYDTGPYEGMPATFTSHERIAPREEPGEPMTLTGRVLGPDGRPRPGIVVYAYQTNRYGIYPAPVPPRSYVSNLHGQFRGWARTDARGRYTFDTIRPGGYQNNPQHVHMHVIEPGCGTYRIDELMFSGDPMLERFTPEQRLRETPGIGGTGVSAIRRKGHGWAVTRDIHLGEKVPGYESCPAT